MKFLMVVGEVRVANVTPQLAADLAHAPHFPGEHVASARVKGQAKPTATRIRELAEELSRAMEEQLHDPDPSN